MKYRVIPNHHNHIYADRIGEKREPPFFCERGPLTLVRLWFDDLRMHGVFYLSQLEEVRDEELQ